jgi:hypothetical protein
MFRKWQPISEADAKLHPLYGVEGWLIAFIIIYGLNFVTDFSAFASAALRAGVPGDEFSALDHRFVNTVKLKMGVCASAWLVVSWLMFVKSNYFRVISTTVIIVITPVLWVAPAFSPFAGYTPISNLTLWIINSIVLITYLHRSRRVRITFEHKVLTSELKDKALNSCQYASHSSPGGEPGFESPENTFLITSAAGKKLNLEDENFWAQAASEVDGAGRRPGLWAKCFAETQGDEVKTRVYYLKLRVSEIKNEHLKQLRLLEKQEEEQKQANELIRIEEEEKLRLITLHEAQRLYESLPKGSCSNCKGVIPLNSESCSKCYAMFGPYSRWTIKPL